MRQLLTILFTTLTAGLIVSCGDEYVSPSFPDVVMPTIEISGATDSDTGVFLASDSEDAVQNFNISVEAAESIFPDCDSSNTLISISDETNFTFTYTAGSSIFSVSPKQINESSSEITATITAEVDAQYGGGVSQLLVTQAKADIPSFITQPSDVTFSSNVAAGSTATTSFVIDPASVTDITTSSFSNTKNDYYYTKIEEMSGTEWGYIVTFYATGVAIDAISSSEDGLSLSCVITLTYGESSVEMSNVFTITMPK